MSLQVLTPATELDAVNALLAATGESPVTSLVAAAGRPDVELAQATLNAVAREVMTKRWRFNTAINVAVAKVGSTFPVPANLLSFDLTPTEAQRGLDIIRSGSTFVDRLYGSDIPVEELRINPVWFVPFSDAPEAARRYITVAAARRYVQQTLGGEEPVTYSAADEQEALTALTADDTPRTPVVPQGNARTETDALNVVLVGSGMSPVAHVLGAVGPQVIALNVLRDAVASLCEDEWKFNVHLNVPLEPLDTIEYDGEVINVFAVPSGAVSATLSPVRGQEALDAAPVVPSVYYNPDPRLFILADRLTGREGFKQEKLWVDIKSHVPYDKLPTVAQRFVTMQATRQFAAMNDLEPRWKLADEQLARRALLKEQAFPRRMNVFDNPELAAAHGGRRWAFGRSEMRRRVR